MKGLHKYYTKHCAILFHFPKAKFEAIDPKGGVAFSIASAKISSPSPPHIFTLHSTLMLAFLN